MGTLSLGGYIYHSVIFKGSVNLCGYITTVNFDGNERVKIWEVTTRRKVKSHYGKMLRKERLILMTIKSVRQRGKLQNVLNGRKRGGMQ
jgi:hypothetical protein